MIESIITDYLQHNRRLVIPELGAFLKKEGGETVFVPFLNKDDGVLAGLVRQAYGTSTAEAEGIIAQYVESVREGVDESGAYLVAPLGSLKKDANGILFLDTADLSGRPAAAPKVVVVEETIPVESDTPEEMIIEEVTVIPEPERPAAPEKIPAAPSAQPEPPKTVAESVDAPKTLNDLIREKQETQEPPVTVHDRMAETRKPEAPKRATTGPAARPETKKQAPAAEPRKYTTSPVQKEKRGDWILIGAIVIAVIAVIAIIYSYAVVDLPLFNLQ